jgi:O-antigen/teichoic acid export membrane protein
VEEPAVPDPGAAWVPPPGGLARRTARNAVVAAVAQVVGKVGTLVWTLLAARELGEGAFGAFSFAFALAVLVSAVAEWGFDPVLVNRGSRTPERLSELFTLALAWELAVGIPVFAMATVGAAFTEPGVHFRAALVVLMASVLVDICSDTCRAASAARQSQGGTSVALVLQRIVTAAVAAVVLLAGGGLLALCVVLLAGAVFGLLAHAVALRRLDVHIRPAAVNRPALRDFIGRTWAIGASALVLMALFRLDAVLLGAMEGAAAVGIYAAAYKLLETVLFVAFSVKNAVFPVMSASTDAGLVSRALDAGMSMTAVVYLPFAVVCLVDASAVLDLLYGEPYATESAGAVRWLALAPLVYALATFGNSGLQARQRTRGMLVAAVVATVVNVALNILLIPQYAGTAAAAVTTGSYVIEAVVVVAYLRGVDVPVAVLRPLVEPGVAAVVMAGLLLVVPGPFLGSLAVALVGYAGTWLLLARWRRPEQLRVLTGVLSRA